MLSLSEQLKQKHNSKLHYDLGQSVSMFVQQVATKYNIMA